MKEKSFRDLPVETMKTIWNQLDLEEKKSLSAALHPFCTFKKCKKHLCEKNPVALLISMDSPRERTRHFCPLCQGTFIMQNYGGSCPDGWDTTNPLEFRIRQPHKEALVLEPQQNGGVR